MVLVSFRLTVEVDGLLARNMHKVHQCMQTVKLNLKAAHTFWLFWFGRCGQHCAFILPAIRGITCMRTLLKHERSSLTVFTDRHTGFWQITVLGIFTGSELRTVPGAQRYTVNAKEVLADTYQQPACFTFIQQRLCQPDAAFSALACLCLLLCLALLVKDWRSGWLCRRSAAPERLHTSVTTYCF
jgi:hypothetical protein